MIVGSLKARLLVRGSRSLKDKRQVVRSVLDRVRHQFGVAAAEVAAHDDHRLIVPVSAALQHAKVYVSVMGSEKEQQLTMYGLEHAAGFVQAKLAKKLATRFVPHVTFVLDPGVKKSIEIARLLREERERAGPAAADG